MVGAMDRISVIHGFIDGGPMHRADESATKNFDRLQFCASFSKGFFAAGAEPTINFKTGGMVAGTEGENAARAGDEFAGIFEIFRDGSVPGGAGCTELTVAGLDRLKLKSQGGGERGVAFWTSPEFRQFDKVRRSHG